MNVFGAPGRSIWWGIWNVMSRAQLHLRMTILTTLSCKKEEANFGKECGEMRGPVWSLGGHDTRPLEEEETEVRETARREGTLGARGQEVQELAGAAQELNIIKANDFYQNMLRKGRSGMIDGPLETKYQQMIAPGWKGLDSVCMGGQQRQGCNVRRYKRRVMEQVPLWGMQKCAFVHVCVYL